MLAAKWGPRRAPEFSRVNSRTLTHDTTAPSPSRTRLMRIPRLLGPASRRPRARATSRRSSGAKSARARAAAGSASGGRFAASFTSPAPDTVLRTAASRRAATCISQEFPDEPPVSGSARQVGDRLGRMEVLVEQLVKRAGGASDVPPQLPAPPAAGSRFPSRNRHLRRCFSSNHTGL